MLGGRDRTVGLFPVGQPVAQDGVQALAAGWFAGLPKGLDERQEGTVGGRAAPARDGPGGGLTSDRKTAAEHFDEVFAPQSSDAHTLVQKGVAGCAAGPAGVSGLLDLKVFADAGMAHG